ncbi:MAG: hypothetical protein Q9223_000442 [Gallowayella weberi]
MSSYANQQLQSQSIRTGRHSFQIHVLFVDQSSAIQQSSYDEPWRLTMEHFSSHRYSVVQLEDIFEYDTTSIVDSIPSCGLPTTGNDSSKKQRLESFLLGMPSTTSRADMIGLLRSQLISHFAKEKGCDSILYGDTTTRLAERTLSETAKGRGGAIPWLTADGDSPLGVKVVYPMRDLLRKEITAYAEMTTPPLTRFLMGNPMERNLSTSSKNSTIEDLMGQYFESVEQHHPSIVANVVHAPARFVDSLSQKEHKDCTGVASKAVPKAAHSEAGTRT